MSQFNTSELSEEKLLEIAEFLTVCLQYPAVDIVTAFALPSETTAHVGTLDKLGKYQLLHEITKDLHDRAYASADTLIFNSKAA